MLWSYPGILWQIRTVQFVVAVVNGCVEAIAADVSIEHEANKWEKQRQSEVFNLFRKNDEKATALVRSSAKAIANLIADMVISLDVQKVVLGGSVGLAEDTYPSFKNI